MSKYSDALIDGFSLADEEEEEEIEEKENSNPKKDSDRPSLKVNSHRTSFTSKFIDL